MKLWQDHHIITGGKQLMGNTVQCHPGEDEFLFEFLSKFLGSFSSPLLFLASSLGI